MKDYYKTIGISQSSNTLEIRKAFRKRALELHPDVNKSESAKEEFILINEAYEVLKNSLSRARYDRLYNHDILHKAPKSEDRFQQRRTRRKKSTADRATQGKRRGEKDAKVDESRYKKKRNLSGVWDFFSLFGDAILFVLSLFG